MASQSEVKFTFEVAGVAFEVIRFELTEALSQPFRLKLELSRSAPLPSKKHDESSEQRAAFDLDALLDADAIFVIQRDGEVVREVRGIVSALEQSETGFRRTRYRAVVEPPLVRLALWQDCRIHQQVDVPEILRRRLKERRIDADFQLSRPHAFREYAVQFRESDLLHVSRLASEEGIAYYFDANRQSRLTFTDAIHTAPNLPGHDDIGTVLYQPNPGGDGREPRLWHFGLRRQLSPTRVVQRDRYFINPQYQHEHRSDARDGVGEYERFDYPGRYKADAVGKPFTQTKLLGLRNEATLATLEGDDARLWPGLSFMLADHPTEAFNRHYRIVSMHHAGTQAVSQEDESATADQGTHYSYTATAVPGDYDWKPAPLARPVMDGPQIADVVGPPGEQIFPDEYGRVKVWFSWDRAAPQENSSCWIRVARGWAGRGYGEVLTPRVGNEVLVSFVDGDCDQPLITGSAHSALNPPPYPLPAHKTVTTLRSDEHKGSGHNELLIDDTTGELKVQLKSTHAATQLNLGELRHPRDHEGRGEARGEGYELRTDASGALRAAKGMLITAYERTAAAKGQLDRSELLDFVGGLTQLAAALLDNANAHHALPADHAARNTLVEALHLLGAGANDRKGEGQPRPILAMTAPDGVVMATPQNVLIGAGSAIENVAHRDHSTTAGERVLITAGSGIGQFAENGGIRHIAHQGDMLLQAQVDNIRIQADQSVEISASEKRIQIAAKQELQLLCGGACWSMREGNVELLLPGKFSIKAAKVEVTGAASTTVPFPDFPITSRVSARHTMRLKLGAVPGAMAGYDGEPYRLYADGAAITEGLADDTGTVKWEHKEGTRTYAVELATGQRFEIDALDDFSDNEDERRRQQHANEGRHPHEHEGDVPPPDGLDGKNFGSIWSDHS